MASTCTLGLTHADIFNSSLTLQAGDLQDCAISKGHVVYITGISNE